MRDFRQSKFLFVLLAFVLLTPMALSAAAGGTVKGTVKLESTGQGLHKARVLIVQLGRSVETDADGAYTFDNVPPGKYDVVARAPALSDERQSVEVTSGGTATADFSLKLAVVRERVNVTASGREQTALETFQSVNVVDNIQLTEKPQTSLGAALDGEPGVAKRSFGPGTGRPVIRGFDGDRVLVMKDGISTSTLSSQSGDHGETIDVLNLERLEVVKGPATLLYGSNAIGGVVNAISPRGSSHEHPHPGMSGYLSGIGGSANGTGGGGAGFEYGTGNWLLWGDAGGNRAGDYDTPIGTIFNSGTRLANGGGGFGWYGNKSFFNVGYGYENARYGIPPTEDELVQLALDRHNTRFNGGVHNLGSWVTAFRVNFDYSVYEHKELDIEDDGSEAIGTLFNNDVFNYRGVFEQRKTGPLTGQFGFSGQHRVYRTVGVEAIAPPVNLNSFSAFTLQELGFEHFRLQFGGRIEHTAYLVQNGSVADRSFTGFSGAAGINVPLWTGAAFVANYTHAYRAPALEELYNNGPHPGNATFEIGTPALMRERSDGIDLSLRQQSSRVRAEANFFYYGIRDFVFLAPTGDVEDGLLVAEYLQAKTRFVGGEFNFDVNFLPGVWLLTGFDLVNAELRSAVTTNTTGVTVPAGTPLPRIPPVRGRVGLDFRWRGLSVRPMAKIAARQDNIFVTETPTNGYAVVDLDMSYTVARQHAVHVFSVGVFNIGDELYRNHLSFIKAIAPEIGRGVRVSYTVRFF